MTPTTENTDSYFKDLEADLLATKNLRKKLITKLDTLIEETKIDFTDKLSVNQSKIGIISSYTNLLNDLDNQGFSLEKLKLSKKEKDNESKYSELIVKYLYNLEQSDNKKSNAPILNDDKLEELQEDIEVLPGEIE